MPKIIKAYVHYVDAINRLVGRIVLYLVFVLMGILLFSAASRYFFHNPVVWGVEVAQFCTVAYYMLGGGFALLIRAHVRMDVLYSRWSLRKQGGMDIITSICLIGYLVLLLYGGLSSTAYSIEFGQRNNTAWAPYIAPIKIIMVIGILLTLLQAFSEFFKAIAQARGIILGTSIPELVLIETNDEEKVKFETAEIETALSAKPISV